MAFENEDGSPVRNTWAMDMSPKPQEPLGELDAFESQAGLDLLPVFSGEKFREAVNYPIIVEMWDKKKAGRVKRAWEKEFTSGERNKIARYYGKFYKWHLTTGTPKRVALRLNTLQLLRRAVHFFATV